MTKKTKYFIDRLNEGQLTDLQEIGNEFYNYAQKLTEQGRELAYKEFDFHFTKRLEYLNNLNK